MFAVEYLPGQFDQRADSAAQCVALLTLKEYLEDYASEETKRKGEIAIAREMEHITNDKVKAIVKERLQLIEQGKRDFRF